MLDLCNIGFVSCVLWSAVFARLSLPRIPKSQAWYSVAFNDVDPDSLTNLRTPTFDDVTEALEVVGVNTCGCQAKIHHSLYLEGSEDEVTSNVDSIQEGLQDAWTAANVENGN